MPPCRGEPRRDPLRYGAARSRPGTDRALTSTVHALLALVALVLFVAPVAAAPTPLIAQRSLTRPGESYDSTFGRAVAVSGSQVLVGDPGHYGGDGAAHLFDARSGAALRTLDGVSYDPPLLGRHLGFLGTAPLVGGQGAFLLFDGLPGVPGRIFRDPGAEDPPPIAYGRSLAGLDATHVLVGHPQSTAAPGRVVVLEVTSGTVTATLTAPTPANGDHFGHAIALTPTSLLVAAPFGDIYGNTFQDTGSENAAVHVFDRTTFAWQRTLAPPSLAAGSLFGHAVAANGTTAVVGAPGEHPNAEREGAAYLFDVSTGAMLRRIANPTAHVSLDEFGFSVAALPDRVVVGAPWDNTAEEMGHDLPGAGSIFVFGLDGTPLQQMFGGFRTFFGWSMAALGGGVAVGAPSPSEENGFVTLFTPCGDGTIDPAEVCDDGNTVDGDGCDSDCSLTACGNGVTTAGEACDDGPGNAPDGYCLPDCRLNVCGDGMPLRNQGCDDGNRIDGDGCDSNCTPSLCFGGGTIERARLTIDRWGAPFGDERVHVSGQLVFPGGAPPRPFDPAARGAQLRAEVGVVDAPFGPVGIRVADMAEGFPIPSGLRGEGCTPADGWRVRSASRLQTYENPSKRLRPPTCSEYGHNTVERLHFGLWRGKGKLSFRARTHEQYLGYEDAPQPTSARVVLVLGAEADAGPGGDCAVQMLTKCRVDRGAKRLRCWN